MREGASKLRIYKSFQKNTSLFNTHINFDSLARTDCLVPAFHHKEDPYSLKFRFLLISKLSNICLLLSQFFLFPVLARTFSFFCPEKSNLYLSWLISCYYFQTVQKLDSYRVLTYFIEKFKSISLA